jgi:hypothetical protein
MFVGAVLVYVAARLAYLVYLIANAAKFGAQLGREQDSDLAIDQ